MGLQKFRRKSRRRKSRRRKSRRRKSRRRKSRRRKQQNGGNHRNRRSRKRRRNRHSKRRRRRARSKRGGAENMLGLTVGLVGGKYYCGGENLPLNVSEDNWEGEHPKCEPGSQCPWCAWFELQATDPDYVYAGNNDNDAPKKPPAGLKPPDGWKKDAPSGAAIANESHYTVMN